MKLTDKKRNIVFTAVSAVIIVLLIAADQLSKIIVSNTMQLYDGIVVIPGFFELKYVHNEGISFGLLSDSGMSIIISCLTAALIVAMAWYLFFKRPKSLLLKTAMILIIGGGIGNLIDRVILGYVVDFLLFSFDWFPFVFNIADCFVVIGGGLFLIHLIIDLKNTAAQKQSEDL